MLRSWCWWLQENITRQCPSLTRFIRTLEICFWVPSVSTADTHRESWCVLFSIDCVELCAIRWTCGELVHDSLRTFVDNALSTSLSKISKPHYTEKQTRQTWQTCMFLRRVFIHVLVENKLACFCCPLCINAFDISVAGWVERRKAETGRKQDGVCTAWLRAWPWSGLWECPHCDPGGQTLQSLHV